MAKLRNDPRLRYGRQDVWKRATSTKEMDVFRTWSTATKIDGTLLAVARPLCEKLHRTKQMGVVAVCPKRGMQYMQSSAREVDAMNFWQSLPPLRRPTRVEPDRDDRLRGERLYKSRHFKR